VFIEVYHSLFNDVAQVLFFLLVPKSSDIQLDALNVIVECAILQELRLVLIHFLILTRI